MFIALHKQPDSTSASVAQQKTTVLRSLAELWADIEE
jgi:hypothetical protein